MFSLIGAVFALCILGLSIYVSNVSNTIEASSESGSGNTKEKVITINAKGFAPKRIFISVGDQVTWKNADFRIHQIVFSFGSIYENLTLFNEKLEKGDMVSFVFEKKGVYRYLDKLFPQFTGEVIVK